jgi:hypothetical protein
MQAVGQVNSSLHQLHRKEGCVCVHAGGKDTCKLPVVRDQLTCYTAAMAPSGTWVTCCTCLHTSLSGLAGTLALLTAVYADTCFMFDLCGLDQLQPYLWCILLCATTEKQQVPMLVSLDAACTEGKSTHVSQLHSCHEC